MTHPERNPDVTHEQILEEAERLKRMQPPVREPRLEDEEAEADEDERDGLGPRPGG
jgi:hypothetical protein